MLSSLGHGIRQISRDSDTALHTDSPRHNFSAAFHKRRGGELFLFRLSIILAVLFVLSALIHIIV